MKLFFVKKIDKRTTRYYQVPTYVYGDKGTSFMDNHDLLDNFPESNDFIESWLHLVLREKKGSLTAEALLVISKYIFNNLDVCIEVIDDGNSNGFFLICNIESPLLTECLTIEEPLDFLIHDFGDGRYLLNKSEIFVDRIINVRENLATYVGEKILRGA